MPSGDNTGGPSPAPAGLHRGGVEGEGVRPGRQPRVPRGGHHLALQAPRFRWRLPLRALLRGRGAGGGGQQSHQVQDSPPEAPP